MDINKSGDEGLENVLRYYNGEKLCTVIRANFANKTLTAENFVDNPIKTAFGNNSAPTWEDFLMFLEDRCIPRQRAGLKEYLQAIGVPEYEPLAIIKKTGGRMAEDYQWLEILD